MANTFYVNPDSASGGDGTTNATSGGNRAWPSLSYWESQRGGGTLSAIEEVWLETLGSADTTQCTIDGSTTDASNYFDIKVSAGHRHAGVKDTAKYRLTTSAGFVYTLSIADPYTRVTGLQIAATGSFSSGIGITAASVLIDLPVVYAAGYAGIDNQTGGSGTIVRNFVVYAAAVDYGIRGKFGVTMTLQNGVVGGCASGGVFGDSSGTSATNVYSGGNTTGSDFSNVACTTCYSEDGSSSTTTSAYSTSTGAKFTNITPGSENFTPQSGSDLIDHGTDLSSTFTNSANGVTRPQNSVFDVGPFEIGSGATNSPADGSCSFAFDCTGVGSSKRASVGAASITLTPAAQGASLRKSVGASSITLTPSAVGASKRATVGSSSISLTASAVGASLRQAAGSSSFSFSCSAIGSSLRKAVGSSNISLSASGQGASLAQAAGESDIIFDVDGRSLAVSPSPGESQYYPLVHTPGAFA